MVGNLTASIGHDQWNVTGFWQTHALAIQAQGVNRKMLGHPNFIFRAGRAIGIKLLHGQPGLGVIGAA